MLSTDVRTEVLLETCIASYLGVFAVLVLDGHNLVIDQGLDLLGNGRKNRPDFVATEVSQQIFHMLQWTYDVSSSVTRRFSPLDGLFLKPSGRSTGHDRCWFSN